MTDESRLVRRRRGSRRRRKLQLALRIVISLAFLGAAALLSAGMIRVVERPVAPWQEVKAPTDVAPAAAPLASDPDSTDEPGTEPSLERSEQIQAAVSQ